MTRIVPRTTVYIGDMLSLVSDGHLVLSFVPDLSLDLSRQLLLRVLIKSRIRPLVRSSGHWSDVGGGNG